jgi:hypothetical protein
MAKQPRYEDWEIKIVQDVVDEFADGGTVGRAITTELMDSINTERMRRGLTQERELGSIEYKFYLLLQKARE